MDKLSDVLSRHAKREDTFPTFRRMPKQDNNKHECKLINNWITIGDVKLPNLLLLLLLAPPRG